VPRAISISRTELFEQLAVNLAEEKALLSREINNLDKWFGFPPHLVAS